MLHMVRRLFFAGTLGLLFLVTACAFEFEGMEEIDTKNVQHIAIYDVERNEEDQVPPVSDIIANQEPRIVFDDVEHVQEISNAFMESNKIPVTRFLPEPNYLIVFVMEDDARESYVIWLDEDIATVMHMEDTNTLYELSQPSARTIQRIFHEAAIAG